jgi:hypothetical protein
LADEHAATYETKETLSQTDDAMMNWR